MRHYKTWDEDEMDKEKKEKLKGVDYAGESIDARLEEHSSLLTFGLCSTCKNFRSAITKFGRVFADCEEVSRIKLNEADPVMTCTYYLKRGSMTLYEMKDMAVLIEVDKRAIGFLKDEKEEKK